MAVVTTLLGFKKPDGFELFRNGDNVIADNAQKAEDLIQADRSRLAGIDSLNTTQNGRLAGLESGVVLVSNIALDTDGVPYFVAGSNAVQILADTDGAPYFV